MATISAELTPHAAVLRRLASSARRGSGSLTFRDDEPETESLRELARHGYLELQRAGAREWTVRLTERGRNLDGPQAD
ncbi:MAG TPA: hypothetical protein VNT60_08920 [Deinococcales bacterium]|nr:hypothetical protein [Deinococcales bacterium]